MIKVAIVDDHPMLIRGLRTMLECTSFISVTGAYLSGKALLQDLEHHLPDVLLMDIQMPDQSGDKLAALLYKQYPQIKILAFTNLEEQYYIKSMLQYGVMGYILKSSSETTLLNGIQAVYEGRHYFDRIIEQQVIQAFKQEKHTRPQKPVLSDREKEVLELIAQSFSSQDIAGKLFISKRTVDFHRINLLLKLDVKNVNGMLRKAIELGLIK